VAAKDGDTLVNGKRDGDSRRRIELRYLGRALQGIGKRERKFTSRTDGCEAVEEWKLLGEGKRSLIVELADCWDRNGWFER
jgi:hypothetical protein